MTRALVSWSTCFRQRSRQTLPSGYRQSDPTDSGRPPKEAKPQAGTAVPKGGKSSDDDPGLRSTLETQEQVQAAVNGKRGLNLGLKWEKIEYIAEKIDEAIGFVLPGVTFTLRWLQETAVASMTNGLTQGN